jgi:hypothetical protein
MACHTGQDITFEDMLNHEHQFAPDIAALTSPTSPAPLQMEPGATIYPQPQPGIKKKREF